MDHSLIYKDYDSLNALLSEPSGCAQVVYDALLRDITVIAKSEKDALAIFNHALWICTRVLIDPNPELHFSEYFPAEGEPKTREFVERRIIRAIVYGVLKMRQSNDFCLQQFLTLFNADDKEAAPSMKHVVAKLNDWTLLFERKAIDLHPYTKQLEEMSDMLSHEWFLCGEEEYHWLDFVPEKFAEFDCFYSQQLLSLLPKDKQKELISALYDRFLKWNNDAKEEGKKPSELYPTFTRTLSSWHYSYTSVHGMGLNIPPCKQYEEFSEPTSSYVNAPMTEKVEYEMHKAMSYLAEKERLFKDQYLPIIKERLHRWWNRIPEAKREEAYKNKLEVYRDELQKSGFFEHYGAEVNPGFYENVACCAESQWEVDRMCADEQFACDFADLHDNMDVLNIEKLERYLWEYQKYISDDQLFSLLTYEEMEQYLPELSRKSSAEGLVNEIANVLKNDDMQKAALVKGKGIVEQEVDGKTDFFVIETFETGNDNRPSITLSFKFVQSLRTSSAAIEKLKSILVEIDPKINTRGGKRSEKWQWPHVCDALKGLDLLDNDTNPTDFGTAINDLLENRTAQSVTQSFKTGRINSDYPNATDSNIIAELKKKFQPVKDLLPPKTTD